MKLISTISLLIFSLIVSGQGSSGYVLQMSDGSIRLPNGSITNQMLATTPASQSALTDSANAIRQTVNTKQNTITVLPFANGGITGVTATSATSGAISVPMTSRVITCTPTGAMTLNATGGIAGQTVTFVFTTSGASSFTITFGTNFRKAGTLATGTTTNRVFAVTFLCIADNSTWVEVGRTAAQT